MRQNVPLLLADLKNADGVRERWRGKGREKPPPYPPGRRQLGSTATQRAVELSAGLHSPQTNMTMNLLCHTMWAIQI